MTGGVGAHAIPSTVRLLYGVLICERSSVGDSPAVHMWQEEWGAMLYLVL